jgi:hypothetical protein
MQITTIGLDITKNVFQVHGIDAAEKVVVRKQLRRGQVMKFFEALPPCLIGMEACATDALALRSRYLPPQRGLQPPHLGFAAFDHLGPPNQMAQANHTSGKENNQQFPPLISQNPRFKPLWRWSESLRAIPVRPQKFERTIRTKNSTFVHLTSCSNQGEAFVRYPPV